ncbi:MULTISPECIES: helix-turn-helix transcriptional regulator [unclassified Clostridium]|uniref:helix-turn-helix domain-containing protein n=1 Tax=unclassified Clostridium TaxID=2614128 RepID=UPI0011064084|nr:MULTISPECIES: helix-turn-helix transcriptional regulator [unclassified Clostridium]
MGYATKRFSKRLKQLRETAGLTQEQFAKELKVSRGAISYYEKGERTPDIEFLDSLYDYFNCTLPVDYLLGNTDNYREEHKNMFDFYGLTDNACNYLERNTDIGIIISTMLEDDDFYGLTQLYRSTLENHELFDYGQIEYISFLITQSLKEIISRILHANIYNQFTDKEKADIKKENIETEQRLKKLYDEHEKFLEESRIRSDKDWEIYRKEHATQLETIEKIHEQLSEIGLHSSI